MITEIYVPRPRLADFMAAAAEELRRRRPVIYGTVRLIERDEDSFLAWAREPWACVVVNLCTSHTPAGIARAAGAFRWLIDLAKERGGSYFLTYHRWATREQVEACHPRFRAFLDAKRRPIRRSSSRATGTATTSRCSRDALPKELCKLGVAAELRPPGGVPS